MTSSHALRGLTLATLAVLGATSSFAQDDRYFYGGLSVGRSRANFDEQRIAEGRLPPGVDAVGIAADDRDIGYKVFGGYQLNRYLAFEGGYFDLGKFSFDAATNPHGSVSGRIRLQGINLDLVGLLPITDRLSALARVGTQYARTRDEFGGSGAGAVLAGEPNPSRREANYKFGAGLQYALSPSVLVRAEAERYRVSDAVGEHGRVNLYSVSLVFPFGRSPAPAPRVAVAPAYVAPPPEPAAVVAAAPPVVPPPPAPRRVSFSAESLFAFDQKAVKPEGRSALDTFAKELQGTQFDTITVEGHTDRLGSTAYNQTLSQQRAEAVKAYLVGTGGLDIAKITAVGKGESQPVTRADDCQGNRANARLVACLQADRRVEVEVAGTR